MAGRKRQRIRNNPRHDDFVRQRRKDECTIGGMRQALDMVAGKESRIHTLVSIGKFRLVRLSD